MQIPSRLEEIRLPADYLTRLNGVAWITDLSSAGGREGYALSTDYER